jgi:hypothetical protein
MRARRGIRGLALDVGFHVLPGNGEPCAGEPVNFLGKLQLFAFNGSDRHGRAETAAEEEAEEKQEDAKKAEGVSRDFHGFEKL